MRSAKADHLTDLPPAALDRPRYLCTGQSYLERLGVLYMDDIRLTILRACSMREIGRLEFFELVGGSSYASIRRHFLKMEESGWLRKVRTVPNGRGRPEVLYRATELAVIDEDTWATIPVSIRDAFTAMLFEDMGTGLAKALEDGRALAAKDDQLGAFRILEVDERAWCMATNAFMRCYQALGEVQIDAKVRLESSQEHPLLLIVHLGAFEVPGPQVPAGSLPKAVTPPSVVPWPRRIGKVFSDQLDLAIVDKLNAYAMTAEQLREALGGGGTTQAFLRRCKRLTRLGLAVNVKTQTGGSLGGAKVPHFRAAAPNLSEEDILGRIPASARTGLTWETFDGSSRSHSPPSTPVRSTLAPTATSPRPCS